MNDHTEFDDTAESNLSPEPAAGPPHPINWNLLTAHDLEQELLVLNRWVNWLRTEYGLPASEIPPMWHRHPELLWELSALHLHWLCAHDPEQDGSAPFGWHRDFCTLVPGCATGSPQAALAAIETGRRGKHPGPAKNNPLKLQNRSLPTVTLTLCSSFSTKSRPAKPQKMPSLQASKQMTLSL